jgi:IS30 family transposase
MRAEKNLTKEEHLEIINMYLKGLSAADIGEIKKRNPATIFRILQQNDVGRQQFEEFPKKLFTSVHCKFCPFCGKEN